MNLGWNNMNRTQIEIYIHNFEPENGQFKFLKRSSNNIWGAEVREIISLDPYRDICVGKLENHYVSVFIDPKTFDTNKFEEEVYAAVKKEEVKMCLDFLFGENKPNVEDIPYMDLLPRIRKLTLHQLAPWSLLDTKEDYDPMTGKTIIVTTFVKYGKVLEDPPFEI